MHNPDTPTLRSRLHTSILKKMRRAGWQCHYPPGVAIIKRNFLSKAFNVSSSSELTEEQLRQALLFLATTEFNKPPKPEYATATTDQLRKIVRIGKHVLGPTYGPDWYLKQLAVYTRDMHQGSVHTETGINLKTRRVHALNQLTAKEAYYVIQRLEKVEYALYRRGKKP